MSRFTARAKELFSAVKTGDPIARLDRSVDAETLWPGTLEQAAEYAASILRSFFFDGFIVPYRTLGVCDQQIIKKCHGLAVFHLLRDGLNSPTANGNGVLITRLPDGKWSGASAILIDNNTPFPSGVDVMDVVLVINDKHAMDTLMDDTVAVSKCLTVAPGAIPQSETQTSQSLHGPPDQAQVWSYAKSKGELVEFDLGSIVIREEATQNETFYGIAGISRREILSGQVKTPSIRNHLSSTVDQLDKQTGSLSGLPRPGRCPGDCRVKVASNKN
ncbi:SH3 domain-containing protein [Acrodontium crateriforme]|uniref:SH3 domain-containing protein n=1 Tax=Acrodontium crateriforme TaxID=150365 RepID=A0AAQ3M7V4_9PEZI|nr:SH3 domain-containing protein [Acrodontium crateriforme]